MPKAAIKHHVSLFISVTLKDISKYKQHNKRLLSFLLFPVFVYQRDVLIKPHYCLSTHEYFKITLHNYLRD